MRGVLNINKPSGISSYDVIRRLKRILGSGKPAIGHAGTLDPLASGVLLILVGDATKISRLLLNSEKEYEAEVLFGMQTDTDDITGKTLTRTPVPDISTSRLRTLLQKFTGRIEQVPPCYSALKKNGAPLYRLARKGINVEMKPRTVTIHELELIDWSPPRVRLRALVSAGTYIRALARDLGKAAGSTATLAGLVRTRSGRFPVEKALALEQVSPERLAENLMPIDEALAELPRFTISPAMARCLLQGQKVRQQDAPQAEFALACTADRDFLALVTSEQGMLRPRRIIYADW